MGTDTIAKGLGTESIGKVGSGESIGESIGESVCKVESIGEKIIDGGDRAV